jgi:uncharacterized protein YchJ
MTAKKFDPAIRRRMYWSKNVADSTICPECGSSLTAETHAYVIAAQEKKEITTFASINEGGSFCASCPVVVLDNEVFGQITKESPDISRFQVMGLIDEANTTDDDVAIAEFLTDKGTIRNTDKKVGRNDPCPCGSGKKYKKCCMQ